MAVFSIIPKSQLEGAKRLDAEYYQPEFLDVAEKIKKFGFSLLQDFSTIDITKGETPLWRGDDYLTQGLPFLRSENLIPSGLDLSNIVFISEKVHQRMKRSIIRPNDVLLAIVGATIGQTGLVGTDYSEYNSNQANAIIRPENEKIAYYLSIVLETKFCQLQIERLKGGGARDNLDLHEVKVIKIPKAENKILNYCNDIVCEVKKFREDSKSFYSEAEGILLKELGLENFGKEESLFSIVNLSEVKENKRIDAEFYQSKFEKMINEVKERVEVKNLDEVAEFRRGIFVPIDFYTEEKTKRPYIRIKELSGEVGIDESKIIFVKDKYEEDKLNELQENDLVIAIIGDTIGKVNKINKELAGGFCSNNTGRIRIKQQWKEKIIPDFFDLLFQSKFIQSQVEKKKAQTGQPKISDKEIRSIIVPV